MNDAKDFADLKFKAECGEMILSQVGGSKIVIKGPGEIWQTDDGVKDGGGLKHAIHRLSAESRYAPKAPVLRNRAMASVKN